MSKLTLAIAFATTVIGSTAFAEDISGTWKNIDDKTGSSKAILEIRQESNGTYTAKIVKVTPRPGYTPKETCVNCPTPYTNKPILGMDIIKGLKHVDGTNNYEKGRVIDPLSGKLYDAKMKLNATGKRLSLRAYIGVSALGRNQTWLRID
ncbi:DUF2147 domain-containing protein [Acinetobacter sp. SwsAc7]|jgi:uncharacterized protein (DUF2147 family)|nr:DUF2147 domain-containing protein [Acinetobacter sp. SwsAc7]